MLKPLKKILDRKKHKNLIENYKIDEDFVEAKLEVKDLDLFIEKFREFLNQQDVRATFHCHELLLQLDQTDRLPIKFDGVEGMGFVDNFKISCGSELMGLIVAKFIDKKFFILSPQLRRKVPPDEVKHLKEDWKTPIEPIRIYLKPVDIPKFTELFEKFVREYRDTYPNPLSERFAPRLREIR